MHSGAHDRGRDPGGEVAVADEPDARPRLADVGDEPLVAGPVEHDDHQVVDLAVERLGERLEVVLHRGVDVDLALGRRPHDELLHVDVGRVQEAALLGGGDDGDGVGRAGGAQVRALQRVDGDVDREAAAADLLADVEHGRLVPLALTDHDRAVDVDALHLLAHRLDRHLVGVLAVSLAHGAGGGHGRPLHHPHELQEQVVSMHGLFPLNAEDAEVTERARRKESILFVRSPRSPR